MRDLLHALSRMQADRDTEAYTLMCIHIIGEMEKEDFAELSGFSGRTEWQTQGAMTLTKGP
ncbi:hypothetical protein ALC57_14032 [Trachymyrmex cornetzi]|uniref:Uncharacterized protein n=1 Tax=Trachymyrmex cornetzi TaxID=471704 RepID=A0A195DM46_9HYME|nr:hypothetical protein ALC57_14032 [Trachymyrmex cornetzi]